MAKIVIAGSRTIFDYSKLLEAISNAYKQGFISKDSKLEIVSGGAKGVDTLAKKYALEFNHKYTEMKPKYKNFNDRYAPLKRNEEMAKYGDVLIAIWDGKSKGTQYIIEYMEKLNKPVFIYKV